jgi:hypothetical protein
LISGQATVLYGASTFSEDVDLWVEPTAANWRRLVAALHEAGARAYKLTPPLTPRYVRGGHGFHFTVPDLDSPGGTGYLDIMGVPPRVGSFRGAWQRARWFTTAWGRLRVVGPADLVRLKLTRRLADYAVISALVRLTNQRRPGRTQWEWAVQNTFEVDDLLAFWKRGQPAWRQRLAHPRPAIQLLCAAKKTQPRTELSRALLLEMEVAREADVQYWQPVLAELRQLQRRRQLLPVGTPITPACTRAG